MYLIELNAQKDLRKKATQPYWLLWTVEQT